MVPNLGGVVENARLGRLAGRGRDDFPKRFAFKIGARNQLVRIVDVELVVFAVVKVEGFGADVRA